MVVSNNFCCILFQMLVTIASFRFLNYSNRLKMEIINFDI